MAFSLDQVELGDRAHGEIERISTWLRETVLGKLKRRGVVLGLSGGIDSSVVAATIPRYDSVVSRYVVWVPFGAITTTEYRRKLSESITLGRTIFDLCCGPYCGQTNRIASSRRR